MDAKRDELLYMICRINNRRFYEALYGFSSFGRRRCATDGRAVLQSYDQKARPPVVQ